MNLFLNLLLIMALSQLCYSKTVATAPSGKFHIEQTYSVHWSENVVFKDGRFSVALDGFPWPGAYNISPDEKWILRTQKTGSGDNVAILYHVENNGRIMEVLNFDELLWSTADKKSPIKKAKLYHTGISDAKWSKNGSSLFVTINGSNTEKSESGIKLQLKYNLTNHSVSRVDK